MTSTLELGRDAVRRHAWDEGVESLTAADREAPLSADDLELLGGAAWWAGKPDDASDALERAFAGYEEAGRAEDAVRVAMTLAYHAYRRLAVPVGLGWQARAERLLAALPESPLHAQKMVYDAIGLLMEGHLDTGIEMLDQAMAVARRTGNTDALYSAMSLRGMADVMAGRWQPGLAELDEAATAASSGRLDLRTASDIFCTTIGACRNVGDLQRAAQWADEGERWMHRNGASGYPGICQVHRAELKMLRGHWTEAEKEVRQACEVLQRFRLMDGLGFAHNALGEIRLRMGDLDAAAEAFDRAYEYGHDGQPGLSLLQLARGEVGEAQRSISRALATATGTGPLSDRTARARLLPAQVDIALASRDLETAQRAVTELEQIAVDFERPLYRAGAMTARGELLLGENKPEEASPVLGQSWRLWQSTDLPYEAARARLHFAEALAAEGEQTTARRDLLAVRAVFERLGATLDLQRVDALLGADAVHAAPPGGPEERATRTFMFTDIVTSTDLVSVIGDEAWNALLEWHDRELRSAIAQHGGQVVNPTGDGLFVAFERPDEAVDAAVDIQRRLLRHRREHGFAPVVRIGLHTAEATRRGRDYTGRGVHIAARVGAAAGREEILATAAVLAELGSGRYPVTEPRRLTLKGVREPVDVGSITWRS
jgi:class 3 adenylate cyclase